MTTAAQCAYNKVVDFCENESCLLIVLSQSVVLCFAFCVAEVLVDLARNKKNDEQS